MFITGSTVAGISSNHISLFCESLTSLLFRLEATMFGRLVEAASWLDKTRCSTKYECPTNPTFNLSRLLPNFCISFTGASFIIRLDYHSQSSLERMRGICKSADTSQANQTRLRYRVQIYGLSRLLHRVTSPRTSTGPSRPPSQHYVQQF
jgi:hypothetical protein